MSTDRGNHIFPFPYGRGLPARSDRVTTRQATTDSCHLSHAARLTALDQGTQRNHHAISISSPPFRSRSRALTMSSVHVDEHSDHRSTPLTAHLVNARRLHTYSPSSIYLAKPLDESITGRKIRYSIRERPRLRSNIVHAHLIPVDASTRRPRRGSRGQRALCGPASERRRAVPGSGAASDTAVSGHTYARINEHHCLLWFVNITTAWRSDLIRSEALIGTLREPNRVRTKLTRKRASEPTASSTSASMGSSPHTFFRRAAADLLRMRRHRVPHGVAIDPGRYEESASAARFLSSLPRMSGRRSIDRRTAADSNYRGALRWPRSRAPSRSGPVFIGSVGLALPSSRHLRVGRRQSRIRGDARHRMMEHIFEFGRSPGVTVTATGLARVSDFRQLFGRLCDDPRFEPGIRICSTFPGSTRKRCWIVEEIRGHPRGTRVPALKATPSPSLRRVPSPLF